MAIFNVTASNSARAAVSVHVTPVSVFAVSSAVASVSAPFHRQPVGPGTGYVTPVIVSASGSAAAKGVALGPAQRTISVSASSSVVATGTGGETASLASVVVSASTTVSAVASSMASSQREVAASGSGVVAATATASQSTVRVSVPVSASSSALASATASQSPNRVVSVFAASGASASGSITPSHASGYSASSSALASAVATASVVRIVSASSSATATGSAPSGRVFTVSASDSVIAYGVASGTAPFHVSASSSASALGTASAVVGVHGASSSAVASGIASASVVLANGTPAPGGDSDTGLSLVLAYGLSGGHPFSFAETPNGDVICANGVSPVLRWEPASGVASPAGVVPPATALALGGYGVGVITGERVAYQRFIDARGNPSNLSPVSNPVVMGFDGLIDDIAVSASGVATVRSEAHSLITGETVVIRGVQGLPTLNGVRTVSVLDPDTFTVLRFTGTPNAWTQGGSWTWGVATVSYSSVPTPTVPVARRQILRNLEGNLEVLYVDVDTTDLNATSFTSTADDETLAAGEPVALSDGEGLPFANRYGLPPSHKSVVVSHHGRVFAAADAPYSVGGVVVAIGSHTVSGVGTGWKACFAGRLITFSGGRGSHEIVAVSESAQTLILASPVIAADTPYATYTIAPAPAERKLVYYSEAGNADAWPPWNVIGLPDDGDTVVGMFSSGSYLYAVETRHVYRLVFSGVPATSGSLSLCCRRGAVNNRCVVPVEDHVFMLDESGVHSYDFESQDKHISTPIHTVFGGDDSEVNVDWSADRSLWHGSHDPARETVRWFVNVVGSDKLDHAVCYHYRADRWWVEVYPADVSASTTAPVGYRRCLAGTEGRRVLALSEGTLDGAPASGTTRGTATSATPTTLTDSTAAFAANLAGCPVSVLDGTGKGQQGLIVSSTTTTITVLDEWATTPDATSVYQIGGVEWHWKSGWFRLSDDQSGNPRDVSMVYKPSAHPATMDMACYYDHSDTPRAAGFTQSNDGVTTTEGSPYASVDLSRAATRPGFSVLRTEGHQDEHAYGDLHIALQLSGVQGSDPVKVYHVVLTGAQHGGTPDA